MTNLQYKETVLKALGALEPSMDSVDAVRKILSCCEVDFPYGECEGILNALSNNNFAQWHECSLDNAIKFANEGIPTVGVSKKQVMVIIPSGEDTAESGIFRAANSLTADERENYKFFSGSNVFAVDGSTSDVPNPLVEGFGGWYLRGSSSKGVVGKVPRFVQMNWGPCIAYAVMSGDYNLHYFNGNIDNDQEIQNAKDFFADRYKNNYLDASGNAQYQNFTTKETYTMSKMRAELDNGKPVVVLGNKTCGDDKTRHAALVVAYTGNGTSLSNFTVIDPWYSVVFPTTYYEFHNRYPHPTTLGGFFNPMLIFK